MGFASVTVGHTKDTSVGDEESRQCSLNNEVRK